MLAVFILFYLCMYGDGVGMAIGGAAAAEVTCTEVYRYPPSSLLPDPPPLAL